MTLQRISMDVEKETWKTVGYIALEKGLKKREVVELAIKELAKKEKLTN